MQKLDALPTHGILRRMQQRVNSAKGTALSVSCACQLAFISRGRTPTRSNWKRTPAHKPAFSTSGSPTRQLDRERGRDIRSPNGSFPVVDEGAARRVDR